MVQDIYKKLIIKYDASPYYTSYPTLSEWFNDFTASKYTSALKELCLKKDRQPIYFYIHFPFCAKQCYYCICNSIITHDRSKIRHFLKYLFREIDLLRAFFDDHSYSPDIRMIHIGGGSPTFMEVEEFGMLIKKLETFINIGKLEEFTVEVDSQTTNQDKLKYYHDNGVNRISLGIQDFDPDVQKAVNRIQTPEFVEKLLSPEVRSYFKGINFDLLYGLPLQSWESFKKTIKIVKQMSPDRITLLKYAHVPDRRKHQKLIKEDDMPDSFNKAMIFIETVHSLIDGGYEYIGIDHFSKPEDDLSKGVKNRTLWRNFNGFSAGEAHSILGIGPTSTHGFLSYYAQNVYSLEDYYGLIDNDEFPILRGYSLSKDDLIRRDVINKILCYQSVKFSEIERSYSIDFESYFALELNKLSELSRDGLTELSHNMITVTPLGRLFIQHVCKAFDHYLRKDKIYKISGP